MYNNCIFTRKILGVLKNVPTDVILRPQRRTDLMIVMDFNAYESDDNFDYAVSIPLFHQESNYSIVHIQTKFLIKLYIFYLS